MDDFRLVISRGRAVWTTGGQRWLPHQVEKIIARAWNTVACRVFGHFDMPDDFIYPRASAVCAYCCRQRLMSVEEFRETKAAAEDLRRRIEESRRART